MYLLFSVYFNQSYTINEYYSICGIVLISIFVFRYVQKSFKDYANIILLGYFLRLLILFLDYYKLAPIPCSGADSEAFYFIANKNLMDGTDLRLTNYSVFLTYLFKIIGPQRLFAQYINVLFGLCTIVYTCKSLKIIDLDKDSLKKALTLVAFFPQLNFLNSILLRESIIICSITVSAYYFIKSIKFEDRHYIYMAIFLGLIAAYMHSGMIGIIFGYLFSYIFYSYKKQKFLINYQTLFLFGISLAFILLVVLKSGLFTEYFDSVLSAENKEEGEEALLGRMSISREAGSAYLSWLNGVNPLVFYLAAPLRMFYFLFSPIPFDWRHLMDVLTFLVDSIFYLYLLFTIIKYKKNNNKPIYSSFTYPLLIGFFVFTFIYGMGTSAAGTAVRHRTKCFPILVIIACIYKKENSECCGFDMMNYRNEIEMF